MKLERVEGFAELFHHYYTALASDFGCASGPQPEWRELNQNERRRLIAATRLALLDTASRAQDENVSPVLGKQGSEGRECGC